MATLDADVPLSPQKILVHACCGPCLEYPARTLLAEDHDLVIYAYNPNIHPKAEHEKREASLRRLSDMLKLPLHVSDACQPEHWVGHDDSTESRCHMCYRVRLEASARKTRDLGLTHFTTTLLVSPYQDQEQLLELGRAAASRYGVTFVGRDFRQGFRQGQAQAKEDGLYRQKFCGCWPSIENSKFKDRILEEYSDLVV